MNLGSKASKSIKEAGGIAKASREIYTASSKYIEDVIKGKGSLLALRPTLILERKSAALIGKRRTFKNTPEFAGFLNNFNMRQANNWEKLRKRASSVVYY